MTAQDYSITFGYGATDGKYYGPNGSIGKFHRGNDRACPIGTNLLIGNNLVAKTGATGIVSGPHLHTQAGTDISCQNTVNPTPYEFKAGQVVALRTVNTGAWGKYITIQVGNRYITYAHLSEVYVSLYQNIKPKEANEVVQNADNYYWRYGVKLAEQIRGRQLSREEFNKFLVGKTDLQAIEILSDDAEADRALQAQRVGQLAIKDDWQGQIYRLIAQVNDLNTRPTKAQLDTLKAQVSELSSNVELANVKAENALKELKEAQAKQSEDTKLLDEAGSWLTKLFNRLFKKG